MVASSQSKGTQAAGNQRRGFPQLAVGDRFVVGYQCLAVAPGGDHGVYFARDRIVNALEGCHGYGPVLCIGGWKNDTIKILIAV